MLPVFMGITKPIDHHSIQKGGDKMNPLYVGIDVSCKTNTVFLMRPDGSEYISFPVSNTRNGARKLVERIIAAVTSESFSEIVIGL